MSDSCRPSLASASDSCAASRRILEASVLFEAPHRIRALLALLAELLAADRRVVIARELTKKFESISAHPAGALAELAAEERGEYVVIVDAAPAVTTHALDDAARRWLEVLLEELPPARAAAVVSQMTGVARETVYEAALELRRGAAPRRERTPR